MGRLLARLLDAALREPAKPIGLLDLLTAGERRELVGEVEAREPELLRLVPEAVTDWASRQPNAVAVACGSDRLSFEQLVVAANKLAWLLRARGIRRGDTVGVCLPRGCEVIVAQLAVLVAGAAYVPLDPGYPADRLAFMINDASVAIVISRGELASALELPNGTGLPNGTALLCLDEAAAEIEAFPAAGPAVTMQLDDIAYVIYTSGSTGKPKGTAINHAGLAHLCASFQREFSITPADRGSQVAALGFDAAASEIWPLLTVGAAVHVAEQTVLDDSTALANWFRDERITVGFLPTPRLELMLDEPGLLRGELRVLVAAGDRLRRRPAPGLPFRLLNGYGPTECSVMATYGEVAPSCGDQRRTCPTSDGRCQAPGPTCWTRPAAGPGRGAGRAVPGGGRWPGATGNAPA